MTPVRRYLIVTYSQSGQTARAAEIFAANLPNQGEVSIDQLNLAEDEGVRGAYRMPWGLFDFLRAQPEAFEPSMRLRASSTVRLDQYDVVVIVYPVWFLSPATPVSSFLRGLPPCSLAGKEVVTIATCRNMWFEAQRMMRALVEEKGGRVIAHVALEDRAPTYATLVTTPRFFLTGERGFSSELMQRLFPAFGITEEEFAEYAGWVRTFPSTGAGDPPCMFRFKSPLALAEVIGRKISRTIYLPWPAIASTPKLIQNAYLSFAAFCTVAGIITLMPPAAIVGKTPPVQRVLSRMQGQAISRRPTGQHASRPDAPHGGA